METAVEKTDLTGLTYTGRGSALGTKGCLAVTPPVNTPLNTLDDCFTTAGGAVNSKALLSLAALTSLADLAVAGFILAKFCLVRYRSGSEFSSKQLLGCTVNI